MFNNSDKSSSKIQQEHHMWVSMLGCGVLDGSEKVKVKKRGMILKTRGPRWHWIAHLNFREDHGQFLFVAFREEFTRISLCPYSGGSPISLMPCLLTDQHFANNFEKGHPRNISMKLFQNLTSGFREEYFLRSSSCLYSKSNPHSLEPKQFLRKVT